MYAIPPDILEALLSGLSQVYDELSANALFDEQWLCECSDMWSDFAAELQCQTQPGNGSPALPLVFDEFKALLFSVQRLALQNASEFGNLGRSDEEALHELATGDLKLSRQSSPGTNSNCLIYTLAAGLAFHGLIQFDGDRENQCEDVRKKLISNPELHPREADGRRCHTAYLEHHRHSKAIIEFLLGSLPPGGIEVVVHTRWCTRDSPAETLHVGCNPDEKPGVTMHIYNWTGRGTRGYHYDLLIDS